MYGLGARASLLVAAAGLNSRVSLADGISDRCISCFAPDRAVGARFDIVTENCGLEENGGWQQAGICPILRSLQEQAEIRVQKLVTTRRRRAEAG